MKKPGSVSGENHVPLTVPEVRRLLSKLVWNRVATPLRCSARRSEDDVIKPAPVDSTTQPAAPQHKCG